MRKRNSRNPCSLQTSTSTASSWLNLSWLFNNRKTNRRRKKREKQTLNIKLDDSPSMMKHPTNSIRHYSSFRAISSYVSMCLFLSLWNMGGVKGQVAYDVITADRFVDESVGYQTGFSHTQQGIEVFPVIAYTNENGCVKCFGICVHAMYGCSVSFSVTTTMLTSVPVRFMKSVTNWSRRSARTSIRGQPVTTRSSPSSPPL